MIKLEEKAVIDGESEFVSWTLPSFDKDNNGIVASEEKLAQDRQAAEIADDESIDEIEADVVPLTAQQLEDIRLQAHKEGYQAGYDEGRLHGIEAGTHDGRQQGEQAVRAELEPALKSETQLLSTLSSQIQSLVDEQQKKLKPLILNMVTGLTRQFIEREYQQTPDITCQLILQGVQALPGKFEEITVYVHPDQQEAISQTLTVPDVSLSVKADNTLDRWDCRLRSEFSDVEINFEARWKSLLEQFEQGVLFLEPSPNGDITEEYFEEPVADSEASTELKHDPLAMQGDSQDKQISNELAEDLDAAMSNAPGEMSEVDIAQRENFIE